MMQPRPVFYYLRLRLLQAWRFFPEHDIHPVVGAALTAALFAAMVALLFARMHAAPWILTAIPVALSTSLRGGKGARALRFFLSPAQRIMCRLGEAALVTIPFLVLLMALGHWLPTAVAATSALLAAVPEGFTAPQLRTLPSPFPAPAFEWNSAWRRFVGSFILYGMLLCVAAAVHNGAIAIVGLVIATATVCASYGDVEAAEMLCVHRVGAGHFLRRKLRLAGVGFAILFLPLPGAASLFFRDAFAFVLIAGGACALWVCGSVLVKYQFYPNAFAVQIAQAFLFVCALAAIALPPVLALLMLVCVFSFFRARNRLRFYLPC